MNLLFLNLGTPEIIMISLYALLPFFLIVYCLIDIVRSDFKDLGTKFLWIIIVLVAPILGSVIYLLIGKKQKAII